MTYNSGLSDNHDLEYPCKGDIVEKTTLICPPGEVTGSMDFPFSYEDDSVLDSYYGDRFCINNQLTFNVKRFWYTFDVASEPYFFAVSQKKNHILSLYIFIHADTIL